MGQEFKHIRLGAHSHQTITIYWPYSPYKWDYMYNMPAYVFNMLHATEVPLIYNIIRMKEMLNEYI